MKEKIVKDNEQYVLLVILLEIRYFLIFSLILCSVERGKGKRGKRSREEEEEEEVEEGKKER